MSFTATQDAKEQVRQAVDIVDLVGSYLPLRRQGRIYLALCPWHEDTRPSLQVNPERQSWKCWVCNLGGDVFSFVMQREGVDFRESLAMLADRAGITLPAAGRAPQSKPGDPNDKRTLYSVTSWAEKQFHQCLVDAPEAEKARRYFEERGISPHSIDRFQLGFAPDSWQWLLDRARSATFSPAVLEAVGLAGRSQSGRYYDRFKGRVIFPIRDAQDRPIAFGGRVLPELAKADAAKYINSPESRLFSKSEHTYGLNLARESLGQARHVVVVEGYTDVIMAHQYELKNVVAVLGTALGPRHIRLLRRYADVITLVLDGDEAGQKRTNEVLELFVASDVDLRILTLPQGFDPCDFLVQRGTQEMQDALASARDALEHAITVQTRGIDLLRDTHRANQALERLLAILAKAPRLSIEATSAKLVRERQVLARLSREFRLDESVLRARIGELRRATPVSLRAAEEPGGTPRVVASDLDPFDAELLEILVHHPELADTALLDLMPDDIRSEPARTIFDAYCRLGERGAAMDFGRVLSELEDSSLKSLLVELDERAQSKDEFACEDAAARLRRLIEDMRRRRDASEQRERLAALEQHDLNEREEVDLLQQLIEQERKRQGISAPTDG